MLVDSEVFLHLFASQMFEWVLYASLGMPLCNYLAESVLTLFIDMLHFILSGDQKNVTTVILVSFWNFR